MRNTFFYYKKIYSMYSFSCSFYFQRKIIIAVDETKLLLFILSIGITSQVNNQYVWQSDSILTGEQSRNNCSVMMQCWITNMKLIWNEKKN